jgi:hypothetical protein
MQSTTGYAGINQQQFKRHAMAKPSACVFFAALLHKYRHQLNT